MDFLVSNAIPIFIMAALAFFIVGRLKRKKDEVLIKNQQQRTEQQAEAAGMNVTAHAEGRLVNTGEVHGDTDYQGTTGGIEWTLRSTVLVGDSAGNSAGRNRVWKRKSMWRTKAVLLPAGKFIMLMSTPGELKTGPIQRGGFVNTMINKAADAVLDIYVTGYFGAEYRTLVSIGEDGVKLERQVLNDFLILTNDGPVAQAHFDEATTGAIAHWKKSNQGFAMENKVDQFGLLFSPDGVILTCQSNMHNAEEVRLFSDFGAALTTKMKDTLAT